MGNNALHQKVLVKLLTKFIVSRSTAREIPVWAENVHVLLPEIKM